MSLPMAPLCHLLSVTVPMLEAGGGREGLAGGEGGCLTDTPIHGRQEPRGCGASLHPESEDPSG